eukprot:33013-Eustigmatos_ZCMA.PRE.1
MIQKIQTLQKRLISKTEEVRAYTQQHDGQKPQCPEHAAAGGGEGPRDRGEGEAVPGAQDDPGAAAGARGGGAAE